MTEWLAGVAGSVVLLLGLTLASIGLYGMLRRPVIFEQLHAAGLVTGPGVLLVLLASLASANGEIATSAILVVAFVLVTASLSTHAIALAAWRSGAPSTPGGGRNRAAATDRAPVPDRPSSAAMRVLVAHDGSPGADVASALAASLSWAPGTVIRVIGSIEGDLEPLTGGPLPAPDRPAPIDLPAALPATARALGRPGVAVDHVIRSGDPATAISDEAESFGADLVIIGSRGLGPIGTLLMGSVAAAVVDSAPCPVLVARGSSVRRVLLATEGARPGEAATEAIAGWPMFEGTSIQVLSVAAAVPQRGDPPAGGGLHEAGAAARQRIVADAAAMRLLEAGRRVSSHVRTGDAAAQIVGFAEARSIDLIVIGTRGRTGLSRMLLGSVARAVLSSTRASVLVVRPGRGFAEHPDRAP